MNLEISLDSIEIDEALGLDESIHEFKSMESKLPVETSVIHRALMKSITIFSKKEKFPPKSQASAEMDKALDKVHRGKAAAQLKLSSLERDQRLVREGVKRAAIHRELKKKTMMLFSKMGNSSPISEESIELDEAMNKNLHGKAATQLKLCSLERDKRLVRERAAIHQELKKTAMKFFSKEQDSL